MTEEELKEKAKILSDAFMRAMAAAISESGSQKNFSDVTGIHQSRISDYVNGNYDFQNLNVGTLIKLFPDLEIIYSKNRPSQPQDNAIDMLEKRLLIIFRGLDTERKISCYENVVRSYGEPFQTKETNPA